MISGYVKDPTVDIIIPTMDNTDYLLSLMHTLLHYTMTPYKVWVVNNGEMELRESIQNPLVDIISSDGNRGWMGGINDGAKFGKAPYILMLNDDTRIMDYDYGWLNKMLRTCSEKNVGAVGPISNRVMGFQNMNVQNIPRRFSVKILSGFCLLTKRELFEDIGGLDETLSGGDDIDYSMEVDRRGFDLVVCRDVFVFHNGYITGRKLHGDHWNSRDYYTQHNIELIRKHGLRNFLESTLGGIQKQVVGFDMSIDRESEYMKQWIKGKALEIGCGGKKLHEDVIGIDVIPQGESTYTPSQCHFRNTSDLSYDGLNLPFNDNEFEVVLLKHVLEHFIEPWKNINEIHRVLKKGGKVVVTVPDESVIPSIPLDPTHLHAYTPQSLKDLFDLIPGFKDIELKRYLGALSFTLVLEKQ